MPPESSRQRLDAEQLLPADHDPFMPASVRELVRRFGAPLFIIDADRVRLQYALLAAALPGVDLHYALKPLSLIHI